MAKSAKQRLRAKARKVKKAKKSRGEKRGEKRGFAGIYAKADISESNAVGTISFGPAEVEVNAVKRKALMTAIRKIYKLHRDGALSKQGTRTDIRDYLGTSGHAFADVVRIKSLKSIDAIVDDIITTKLMGSLATGMGGVIEKIATMLPLSERQRWITIDSDKSLKDRVAETLGADIVRQLRLYGVHDCEGGKILRLVGLKLNSVISNGPGAHYASNSLSDIAAISKLAKSVGADRVEVILGRAYDHGDTQPKSILNKLAAELEPRGWKRFDVSAGHPCIASANGNLQFRVMVGSKLWGYLAKLKDKSGELDVMAMLSQAQDEIRPLCLPRSDRWWTA